MSNFSQLFAEATDKVVAGLQGVEGAEHFESVLRDLASGVAPWQKVWDEISAFCKSRETERDYRRAESRRNSYLPEYEKVLAAAEAAYAATLAADLLVRVSQDWESLGRKRRAEETLSIILARQVAIDEAPPCEEVLDHPPTYFTEGFPSVGAGHASFPSHWEGWDRNR